MEYRVCDILILMKVYSRPASGTKYKYIELMIPSLPLSGRHSLTRLHGSFLLLKKSES